VGWDVRVATPWAVALLALVAVAAWWLSRRLAHRTSRVLTAVVAVVVAGASVADSVNTHFDYLPLASNVVGISSWPTVPLSIASPAVLHEALAHHHYRVDLGARQVPPSIVHHDYDHGAVTTLPIPGRNSGYGDYNALVWLPPQYFAEPTHRFPVLYLLHGSPGVPQDWLRGGQAATTGLAAAQHGNPLIIVMPRVSHGWLDDSECVDGVEGKAQTYLVDDIVPTVDRTLRTYADRTHRAIGGMSAGGFCALNVGLRHRALFRAILDMSGDTHPTHSGGWQALFGKGAGAAYDEWTNDPRRYAPSLPPGPPLAVWMDVGRSDHAIEAEMRALVPVLEARGIPVRLGTRPGGHTFHVWAPALRDALAWLAPLVQR
jgi:enterochelin esterase-like enzyme